jgi:putative transposase
MDEVVITIAGRKFWLWRAIDAEGDLKNTGATCSKP